MENTTTSKSPLIPNNAPTTHVPAGYVVTAINALAWGRVIAGAMAVVTPSFTARLFQLPGVASTSLAAYQLRLFGIRDAMIGELLWIHRPKLGSAAGSIAGPHPLSEGDRKNLRTMLWANVTVDALDVVATVAAVSVGAIPKNAALFVGGGAAAFLSLGLVGLAKI